MADITLNGLGGIQPGLELILVPIVSLSLLAAPPKLEALWLSKRWAKSLYTEIKSRSELWITPHLTVQDGGNIVFEWWSGERSLSVYVSADEVWFLQSAGGSYRQNEGNADTPKSRRIIWQWLTNQEEVNADLPPVLLSDG